MTAFASRQLLESAARERRILFFGAVFLLFLTGLQLFLHAIPAESESSLRFASSAVFAILCLLLCFGFVLALTGFFVLRKGRDPFSITNLAAGQESTALPNTAIILPIFNEDVRRVIEGVRIMYTSLNETGHGDSFDFFILSDSNDPNHWIEEEKSWLALCKELNAFGRIFYRKRRVTLNHKSGNVADFCRRWGANYRYMIVADADSIMTGSLLVKLVGLMERAPETGIIQTVPKPVLGKSLFRRVQQYAAHVYGPIFTAGSNFWHLGGGSYWGHNAIIRVAPFVRYCALPELDVPGPLGGRILSHDTVEAALMRRAGYEVWIACDLEGSYEESPPHLPASLMRDRRWCQGNLQHLFVLGWPRLKASSRLHILLGLFAYLSAPLWLCFMGLTLAMGIRGDAASLSVTRVPTWTLFAFTLVMLFSPKMLGWIHSRPRTKTPLLGSLASLGIETLFSVILAPILMWFYSKFVVCALTGIGIQWKNQTRNEALLDWGSTMKLHWANTATAAVVGFCIYKLWPAFLPWISPVLLGLVLSIPFTRWSSSPRLGQAARRRGLFLIREEIDPPAELKALDTFESEDLPAFFRQPAYAPHYGLLQAILDPYVHSVHVSLLRLREQLSEKKDEYLKELGIKLLALGPGALSAEERSVLLWEPDCLIILHKQLWLSPRGTLAEWWENALRHYNETIAIAMRRTAVRDLSAANGQAR